jgi:hypothetical protein
MLIKISCLEDKLLFMGQGANENVGAEYFSARCRRQISPTIDKNRNTFPPGG